MDSVNEFVIEWIKGEKTASLTIPSNTRLKNKILKLAEKHKDADYIENKDGSIFAHIPVDWIKIYPSREVSEEEKEKLRELFNKNVKGNK